MTLTAVSAVSRALYGEIFRTVGKKLASAGPPARRNYAAYKSCVTGTRLAQLRETAELRRGQETEVTAEQRTIQEWVRLIKAEYLEMPGLRLTKPQIQRLWTLAPEISDRVIDTLVSTHFLRKTANQAYMLAA